MRQGSFAPEGPEYIIQRIQKEKRTNAVLLGVVSTFLAAMMVFGVAIISKYEASQQQLARLERRQTVSTVQKAVIVPAQPGVAYVRSAVDSATPAGSQGRRVPWQPAPNQCSDNS